MRTYLKLASLVTTEPGASPARALDNVSGARLELGDAALKRIGLRSSQDMEERVTRRAEVKMAEKCILTVWWLVSWIEVLKVGWFGIDLVCSDSNVVADDEKDVWEDLEGVFMSFRLSSNFLF